MKPISKVLYHHRTQGRGVEAVHIRGVVDALRAKGIHVEMLSLPNADPYQERHGGGVTATSPWKKIGKALPEPLFELLEFVFNLVSFVRVWRWVSAHRDADFIYERYSLFLFSTVLLARMRNIPIILEINDSSTVPRVRHLFFASLANWVEAWTFRRASGLIFVSTDFRDICSRTHRTMAPCIVSHNAANIADFTCADGERERVRDQYAVGQSLVCGYLGAFIVWHKIDVFVETVAEFLTHRDDVKFLLVGDGATYEKVKRFVEDKQLQSRIILTGRVPHTKVPSLLSAMDIAILPAAADYSSPVKLFEFMAAGVPAVAPDYNPVKEILVDGENGWLFPAENVAAAVSRLFDVSRDPAALRRVGHNAKQYITQSRQWSHNIDQLLDLVARVGGRR